MIAYKVEIIITSDSIISTSITPLTKEEEDQRETRERFEKDLLIPKSQNNLIFNSDPGVTDDELCIKTYTNHKNQVVSISIDC